MWLSATLFLTMVLTLDSCWSLYIGPLWPTKYWKNTTAWLQHKPQTGCHKTFRKLLNKHLLMATFENGPNYPFEISNNGPMFDSKWKHCLHSTSEYEWSADCLFEKTFYML